MITSRCDPFNHQRLANTNANAMKGLWWQNLDKTSLDRWGNTSQVPRPTCGSGSGERRVCTRGIFLQWPIVAKIFIESWQLRTELACSTRELALSHWPNSQKCTGCGCRAVFLPSSSLPLVPLRFATCIFRIFSTGFLSDSCSIFVSTVKLHASALTSIPSLWKEHETWTALAILVIACQLRVASLTPLQCFSAWVSYSDVGVHLFSGFVHRKLTMFILWRCFWSARH